MKWELEWIRRGRGVNLPLRIKLLLMKLQLMTK